MARVHLNNRRLVVLIYLTISLLAIQAAAKPRAGSHSKSGGHHGHQARTPDRTPELNNTKPSKNGQDEDKDEVWLDAYDDAICGHSEIRPRLGDQSAFGCTGVAAGNSSNTRFTREAKPLTLRDTGSQNFLLALDSEFPWYVRIRSGSTSDMCSGVLVSKDIVLTTAHDCLRPLVDMPGGHGHLDLEFGSILLDSKHSVRRKGRKWCTSPSNSSDGAPAEEDLGVIILDKPVKYNRFIQPACLRLGDQADVSNETICVLGASCGYEPVIIPIIWNSKLHNSDIPILERTPFGMETRSMAMKRVACDNTTRSFTHRSCYQPTVGTYNCESDMGASLVCYDKCSSKSKASDTKGVRLKAYAVGLLSQFGGYLGDDKPTSVVDLNKARKRLNQLLRAVTDQPNPAASHNIKCGVNSFVPSERKVAKVL